jgi:hypothetical protein
VNLINTVNASGAGRTQKNDGRGVIARQLLLALRYRKFFQSNYLRITPANRRMRLKTWPYSSGGTRRQPGSVRPKIVVVRAQAEAFPAQSQILSPK